MTPSIELATPADVPAIAALRNAVADQLTDRYGPGHWSGRVTARGVFAGWAGSTVLLARSLDRIVATVRLTTKRPWSIDPSDFTKSKRPVYLIDMAVDPSLHRTGIGRALLDATAEVSRTATWDAIRLDAYDAEAGAGGFYTKCGYREVGRVTYRGTPLIYFESVL